MENTARRLKDLMARNRLRQIDILDMCKPYSEEYNVKISKSDLSQYVNGKVVPGQFKLTILAKALNVSEAWLMGYDVPMERNPSVTTKQDDASAPKRLGRLTDNEICLVEAYRALDDWGRGSVDATLQREYERVSRTKQLTIAANPGSASTSQLHEALPNILADVKKLKK